MKDLNLISRAREFAIKAHGDQKYGGDEVGRNVPYIVHLDAVDNVLIEFGYGDAPIVRAVGYLHDVAEDTDVTVPMIEDEFGSFIAIYVHCVTSEPGKNRKERNAATYPKIRAYKIALIAKLADRLANVRNTIATGSDLFKMYKKEYSDFRAQLHDFVPVDFETDDLAPMWKALDDLMGWGTV